MCDNKVRNFFYQSASVHRIFTGMLLTCQASAASWFIHVIKDHGHVLSFLCDNACKRSPATCDESRHCVPVADFCLCGLHVLNWDIKMIHSIKSTTELIRAQLQTL